MNAEALEFVQRAMLALEAMAAPQPFPLQGVKPESRLGQ